MLNATQARSISATKNYFDACLSQGDYFLGQEIGGTWRGRGADILELGIGTKVKREQFVALLAGKHPVSEKKLAQRIRKDRRPGVDLTFSCPKSISLAWAINKDEEIIRVFREAVHETMTRDIEPLMCRRVRDGKHANSMQRSPTGKLIYADFLHTTSRPVKGQVDPHLHIHAFVCNWTEDAGRHYAGEMEEIIRQCPSLQAKFEARLARKLRDDLGYRVAKTQYRQSGRIKTGWEIEGISREVIDKFSTRTGQVEDYARENEITDASQKAALAQKLREKKNKGASIEDLRLQWYNRLNDNERSKFGALRAGAVGVGIGRILESNVEASVKFALEHHFYRQSTVEKHQVIGTALVHGVTLTPEQVEAALSDDEIIHRTREVKGATREFITTRQVLDAERRMIDFARDGRGTRYELGQRDYVFNRDWLNEQQQAAVRHVLENRDTVTAIMGGAGTGKSSLMEEAAEAMRAGGKEVYTFAPSTGAREVLQEKGFENAQTVEHLLRNEELQMEVRDQVLWIDEAGLMDVRSMNQLFDIAEEQNARIILSGDTRQHSSPRRGEAMRLLKNEAGLNIAHVEEIQRQKGRFRDAVAMISRGHEVVDVSTGLTGLVAGFDMLDRMGKIKEIALEKRHEVLAKRYLKANKRGQSVLIVAPTHAEGQAATQTIREQLREKGKIGTGDQEFVQLKSLNMSEAQKGEFSSYDNEGLVVQFHQNVKGGYKRGERYRVIRSSRGEVSLRSLQNDQLKPLPREAANRFEVYQENKISMAVGDKIRFSLGGTATDRKRQISNGRLDEIKSFTPLGNIVLKSGMTVSRDYGHIDQGYVITSHAAQGKDRKLAIAAMGSQSLPAINAKQFYVTVSRGSEDVAIYVDNKAAVRRAIAGAGEQLSATELVSPTIKATQSKILEKQLQHRTFLNRVKSWWQTYQPGRWRQSQQIKTKQPLSQPQSPSTRNRI